VACWLAAAWAAWRALMRGSGLAWVALGAAVAAGFLFKYTMLLILPGLIGFAIVRRRELMFASGWRVWSCVGAVVAALGLVPVVVWNAQNDWDTVRHLLGHLGMAGGDMPVAAGGGGGRKWSPWWSLELIGMQIGLAGPGLALGVMAAVRASLGGREGRGGRGGMGAGASMLVWCAAPVMVFYLLVSLFAEPEGNWPIAGSTTLLVLAGVWAARAREELGRGFSARRLLWNLAIAFGVCAAPVLLRADVAAAAVTRAVQMARPEAAPIRTGRLIGARAMGEHAAEILKELDHAVDANRNQRRTHPFVIVEHYGRASQMAYYLERAGKARQVYCASAVMGGRRSQFDVWAHTSLADPALVGRDALLLSNDKPHTLAFWGSVFERVDPILGTKLDGEHKKDRVAYIGRRYKGLRSNEE
jgi:hypothetical protein